MANNFKPWVDTPTAGQQVQSASVFASDAQRVAGFKAGDPASALRVNTALRQANVVVAGLMQFCDEVKTLPNELSLLSTVTQVKNAIKASINALHNITLTSAKDYADTRETTINTQISNVQTQVTGNKNNITTLVGRVDEHDTEIAGLSGGTSTLTTRVGTLETEMNTAQADIATNANDIDTNSSAIESLGTSKLDASLKGSANGIATLDSNGKVPSIQISDAILNSIKEFDLTIRTQAEFNTMIASPTWLDAKSVALVGQFTLSTANNSGVKIPSTVKQIQGFNSAKITITNFKYNSSTAQGGLWYDTIPTTLDYSIRDLEVDCTGTDGYGFSNCTNLTNCTGIETGTYGYGFNHCTNLTNCTGIGTGTGTDAIGHGFYNCTNLTNCTGTGTGTDIGIGFYNCTNLTNCTGKGTGSDGYGFYQIYYASNCKDGGSTTAMWGGKNENINVETCRMTPVEVNNTTLNT